MFKESIVALVTAGVGGLFYVFSENFTSENSYESVSKFNDINPISPSNLTLTPRLDRIDNYKLLELSKGGCKVGLVANKSSKTGGPLEKGRNKVLAAALNNTAESKWTKFGDLRDNTDFATKCKQKGSQTSPNQRYLEVEGINGNWTVSSDNWNEHNEAVYEPAFRDVIVN